MCGGCGTARAPKTPHAAPPPPSANCLGQPQPGADDLDQGKVVLGGFLVARGDGAKALEPEEEDLHDVASAIECSVEAMLLLSLRLRVDYWLDISCSDLPQECVRVVAGVANEGIASSEVEQLECLDHLVSLAWGERDIDRAALGVDDRVELGRESSTTSTDSITLDPPFPPDAS